MAKEPPKKEPPKTDPKPDLRKELRESPKEFRDKYGINKDGSKKGPDRPN